jgi:SOS response regulatory protein OraA/RecX
MNLLLRVTNYITRYAPSEERIVDYLRRKKHQNPHALLQEIGYDESALCDIWIRTFIAQGKSEFTIRQKLLQKKFSKSLIQQKLLEFASEIHDWENLR